MDRSLIDRSRRAETGHSPALHGLSALSPPTELTIRRVLCKGSVLPCRRASRAAHCRAGRRLQGHLLAVSCPAGVLAGALALLAAPCRRVDSRRLQSASSRRLVGALVSSGSRPSAGWCGRPGAAAGARGPKETRESVLLVFQIFDARATES